jgi:hypothetical protein
MLELGEQYLVGRLELIAEGPRQQGDQGCGPGLT